MLRDWAAPLPRCPQVGQVPSAGTWTPGTRSSRPGPSPPTKQQCRSQPSTYGCDSDGQAADKPSSYRLTQVTGPSSRRCPGAPPTATSRGAAHSHITAVHEPASLVVGAQPRVGADAVQPQRVGTTVTGGIGRPSEHHHPQPRSPAAHRHPMHVTRGPAEVRPQGIFPIQSDRAGDSASDADEPRLATRYRLGNPLRFESRGPLRDPPRTEPTGRLIEHLQDIVRLFVGRDPEGDFTAVPVTRHAPDDRSAPAIRVAQLSLSERDTGWTATAADTHGKVLRLSRVIRIRGPGLEQPAPGCRIYDPARSPRALRSTTPEGRSVSP